MINRRLMLGTTLAAGTAILAGGARAQAWKSRYPELVFAVIPAENASGVTDRYGPFIEYLSKELGTKVTLRVANDYAAVIEGQRNGTIHIAGYGPASYARAVVTGVKVEPFCTTVNGDGTVGYYSVFYVRADSPYKTMEDLEGKNLGLVDPNSTSGNNVPRFLLNKSKINPESYFAHVTYTGSHENALLVPTRALLVDQALIVKNGIVQARTVKVGYRTLDFSEVLSGLAEGDRAVLSDQDKLRPGRPVRQRLAKVTPRVDLR